MQLSDIIMYTGFAMAAYSVVGNDVIQTLGTFLSSNEKRPWYVLWAFAAVILTVVLVYGWVAFDGDASFGKLIGKGLDKAGNAYSFTNAKYPHPDPMSWWYLIPPFVLLFITRIGIPVSTTFLILTFFATAGISAEAQSGLGSFMAEFFTNKGFTDMLIKSLSGYGFAFIAAFVVYLIITNSIEKKFFDNELADGSKAKMRWTIAQWFSTGFLWAQWLSQDFANIYAYLPRKVSATELVVSLIAILGLLAFIFYQKGGAIQGIVKAKSNTEDIRSATIIDLIYGLVLLFFKGPIPMSTTWVFIGLLAGREYAIQYQLHKKIGKAIHKMVGSDAGKATIGLVVSIVLVLMIQWIKTL